METAVTSGTAAEVVTVQECLVVAVFSAMVFSFKFFHMFWYQAGFTSKTKL